MRPVDTVPVFGEHMTRYEICSLSGLACAMVASHKDILFDSDSVFQRVVAASSPSFAVHHLLSLRREDDDLHGRLNEPAFRLDIGEPTVARIMRATVASDGHLVRLSETRSRHGVEVELDPVRATPFPRIIRTPSGARIVRMTDTDHRIKIDGSSQDPVRSRDTEEGLSPLITALADGMTPQEAAARFPYLKRPLIDYIYAGIGEIAEWDRLTVKGEASRSV